VALGIHTWMKVFLTSHYQGILAAYLEEGWSAREFKREKDALMKFLLSLSGQGKGLDY